VQEGRPKKSAATSPPSCLELGAFSPAAQGERKAEKTAAATAVLVRTAHQPPGGTHQCPPSQPPHSSPQSEPHSAVLAAELGLAGFSTSSTTVANFAVTSVSTATAVACITDGVNGAAAAERVAHCGTLNEDTTFTGSSASVGFVARRAAVAFRELDAVAEVTTHAVTVRPKRSQQQPLKCSVQIAAWHGVQQSTSTSPFCLHK